MKKSYYWVLDKENVKREVRRTMTCVEQALERLTQYSANKKISINSIYYLYGL